MVRLALELNPTAEERAIGIVSSVGDGIARLVGLDDVCAGELVVFSQVCAAWRST